MKVRLLGPVDVVVDGVPRQVTGRRRKALLAALALDPGSVLGTDRLIDIVWGDAPSANAATTLQSHVSHLRRLLGLPGTIVARPPGYLLAVDAYGAEAGTDVRAAEELIRCGARSDGPHEELARLEAAVALWRGQPLAGLTDVEWFGRQAHRLDQLLLQARHRLIEIRLELGEHAVLIPQLHDLAECHPLHEGVHQQLILALYRAGWQADALAAYEKLRRALDEELGVVPGRPLRDLHAAVLRQDPAIDAPTAASGPVVCQNGARLPRRTRTLCRRSSPRP